MNDWIATSAPELHESLSSSGSSTTSFDATVSEYGSSVRPMPGTKMTTSRETPPQSK